MFEAAVGAMQAVFGASFSKEVGNALERKRNERKADRRERVNGSEPDPEAEPDMNELWPEEEE